MKKVLFVGLIAILMSCTQESLSPENPNRELQISLSLGDISTRAVDGSILDSDGKGYVLPFSEIKTLTVELFQSPEESAIYTYQPTYTEMAAIKATPTGSTATLSLLKIPASTHYVKVIINAFATPNPDINQLQVATQEDLPAPTMPKEDIPYEGISTKMEVVAEESGPMYTKVKALVEVAPVLSRFEVKPGIIKIVDPDTQGYTFDWTDGATGRALVTQFSEAEIANAETSARQNFKKKYGTAASASATYSYRISTIQSSFPSHADINTMSTFLYMNYFKQQLTSAALVKNINDAISDWDVSAGGAEYHKGGKHSNMYDARTSDATKVNAFHLFPQSVAADATLQQIKEGMPHLIAGISTDTFKRWFTIRAFRDKKDNALITAFKPGYCYTLSLDDIILTPWSLGLSVRITDNNQTVESDPLIKEYDQTSYVPEPKGSGLIVGLKVSVWREKNIEVDL